ncbi:ABC transporter permease [Pseudonocardia acidicola]|uniref:Transport permease protein n=1 Tax=Pseudonocardia acidicola TaxID=2724939 RepID=A0ABX1SHI2_9PSEU|nr:ABC transporter permease [Pseudonocardia acidicola]NMI01022.1 ABC transporter permease [Pseudonocardia acidicola]
MTSNPVAPRTRTGPAAPFAVPPDRPGPVLELRGVHVVWERELIRFLRNRLRIVTSLVQPILFLFVLGTGLSRLGPATGGYDYRTFVFPGIVAMTVMFTAIFSAVSIVWDREFGFLREMLVAPVSRTSLVVGKILGGATVATLQGLLILAFAGAVGIPYSPALLAVLVGLMLLAALVITAIGVLIASGIHQMEAFQAVLQFVAMPMFFLSGAMFPLTGLPAWLHGLTVLDPLTYVVDPMRRAVLAAIGTPPALMARLAPGVSWGDWIVPTGVEMALLVALAVLAAAVAVRRFGHTD